MWSVTAIRNGRVTASGPASTSSGWTITARLSNTGTCFRPCRTNRPTAIRCSESSQAAPRSDQQARLTGAAEVRRPTLTLDLADRAATARTGCARLAVDGQKVTHFEVDVLAHPRAQRDDRLAEHRAHGGV